MLIANIITTCILSLQYHKTHFSFKLTSTQNNLDSKPSTLKLQFFLFAILHFLHPHPMIYIPIQNSNRLYLIMSKRVFVVGVGMTPFLKPSPNNPDYPQLAKVAITRALNDAACDYNRVEAAIVGYVFGDSTCGQRAVYEVGMTGVPIYNVNNNCATGSSALHLAKNLIAGGVYKCVLAAGFEKMAKGSLAATYTDRTNPIQTFVEKSVELMPTQETPKGFAPLLFGNAGLEHMKNYGTKAEHFAKVSSKNHKHSLNNPYSQFRDGHSVETVLKSEKIYGILTKLQCCPTSDGAGAAILCDEETLKQLKRENQAVEILAMELTTDFPQVYDSCKEIIGYSMAKESAHKAYTKAGIKASDVGVVELHDCFSANELITYEALGLCGEGKAGEFIDKGDNTYGGKVVVNPSGGLTSKGHPLGATGFAQCAQLCWQLRGIASKRQVPNLKYALQHNLGLGGACVVAVYKKYNSQKSAGTSQLSEILAQEAKNKVVQPKL